MAKTTTVFRDKASKTLNLLIYVKRALNIVWQSARPWSMAWAALLVVQGLLPVATVYLTRALVDTLVPMMGAGGGWESLAPEILLDPHLRPSIRRISGLR